MRGGSELVIMYPQIRPQSIRKEIQKSGRLTDVQDEDGLQAILLHYNSMSWSVEFEAQLKNIFRNRGIWPLMQSVPRDELEKREYYLGRSTVRYCGESYPSDRIHTKMSFSVNFRLT